MIHIKRVLSLLSLRRELDNSSDKSSAHRGWIFVYQRVRGTLVKVQAVSFSEIKNWHARFVVQTRVQTSDQRVTARTTPPDTSCIICVALDTHRVRERTRCSQKKRNAEILMQQDFREDFVLNNVGIFQLRLNHEAVMHRFNVLFQFISFI